MITSSANGKIKRLTALQERSRARNKEGVFAAEGVKMFEEAPLERLREIYVSETLWRELKEERCRALREKLHRCMDEKIPVEQVAEKVFKEVSNTQTPQGILFVMEQLSYTMETILRAAEEKQEAPLFLLLEDIQDPGNLGTMIRTCEGAGADGVIMSKGTADIYNPKAIRSTMGSLYRVPFFYTSNMEETIRLMQENHIKVYAAHLNGERFFDETVYEGGSAFLIGNEGNGLRRETADLADAYIKIPMKGRLESLNAAVAAALLLYQAAGYHRKR